MIFTWAIQPCILVNPILETMLNFHCRALRMPGNQRFTNASLTILTCLMDEKSQAQVRWGTTGRQPVPFSSLQVSYCFDPVLHTLELSDPRVLQVERLLGNIEFNSLRSSVDFSSVMYILEKWRSLCSREVYCQCSVCMCVSSMSHTWRSEDSWWELILSFLPVGPSINPVSWYAFKSFSSSSILFLEQTQ